MITCPNCGYQQAGGDKCQKCSSLFSYYSSSQSENDVPRTQPAVAVPAAPGSEAGAAGFFVPWRTVYRVATAVNLIVLAAALVLIFHKSPPPRVAVDPQAAARAAAKLSQAQTAAQQKQPFEVTLNPTELNSYLHSNLQLANTPSEPHATQPTSASSPAPAAAAASPAAPASATAEPTIDDVQSSVKDVKVDMVGDLVKAYVIFDFHGQDMSLELDGHLSSENGYLQFEPVAGQLGSLPLPQSVLDAAVQKLMSSPENREKLRLPAGVNSIKIVNGQVVMN
jgi:hypothetical protein